MPSWTLCMYCIISLCKSYTFPGLLLFRLECATRFNWICLNWRPEKKNHPGSCVHHEHGLLWDSVFQCNGDLQGHLYYFQFFPFIINSCTTLNGNMSGVPLGFAILGVILYIKMRPTLYWCYTVESLVIDKDLVQTTCSTSCCSQSLLPDMLFWNNFRYFCFCLVFRLVLLLDFSVILPVSWTIFADGLKLKQVIMVERNVCVFSYITLFKQFISICLWM